MKQEPQRKRKQGRNIFGQIAKTNLFSKIGFWIFCLMSSNLFSLENTPSSLKFSDARVETIARNKGGKRLFVETGTAGGGGIIIALYLGFSEVYTVELDPTIYDLAQRRFLKKKNVHLYLDDSANGLEMILPLVKEPVLFWLDAHYCGENTQDEFERCPILRELAVIATHPIKTHTILIDDVRLFGTPLFDNISITEVIDMLKTINPDYEISFEDGFQKNDVLVAKHRM